MNPEKNSELQKALSSLTNIERTLCSPQAEVKHIYRNSKEQVCCSVRCIVITVGDIDTVKQEFEAELYLSLRWREAKYKDKNKKDIDWNECWDPRLYFSNAVTITKDERKHRLVTDHDDSGNSFAAVLLSIRMKATFKIAMQLHNFPLDYQKLPIKLMSDWPEEVVTFEKDMQWKDAIRSDTFTGQHEWTLHEHVSATSEQDDSNQHDKNYKKYPMYNISTHVERKFSFYLWNIAVVILFILLLSFTCFSVEASDPASRLGITLTLLLTAVIFKNVVSSRLPTISYLTLLDKYLLACLVCQCCFVVQNAVAVTYHAKISEHFDCISVIILVLAVIFMNGYFIVTGIRIKFRGKGKLKKFTHDYDVLCNTIDTTVKGQQQKGRRELEEPESDVCQPSTSSTFLMNH